MGWTSLGAGHQAWQLMADGWNTPEQIWPFGGRLCPYSELLFSYSQRIPSHPDWFLGGRRQRVEEEVQPG